MRKRVFKDRQVAKAYENALSKHPTDTDSDQRTKAYLNGYSYPERRSMHVTGSILYAYWAAGVDQARHDAKQRAKRAVA